MTKELSPEAIMVAKAIKEVDSINLYHWKKAYTCLGGCYERNHKHKCSPCEYERLSEIAFMIHMGLPPNGTYEEKFRVYRALPRTENGDVAPIVAWDDWATVKAKLKEHYELA